MGKDNRAPGFLTPKQIQVLVKRLEKEYQGLREERACVKVRLEKHIKECREAEATERASKGYFSRVDMDYLVSLIAPEQAPRGSSSLSTTEFLTPEGIKNTRMRCIGSNVSLPESEKERFVLALHDVEKILEKGHAYVVRVMKLWKDLPLWKARMEEHTRLGNTGGTKRGDQRFFDEGILDLFVDYWEYQSLKFLHKPRRGAERPQEVREDLWRRWRALKETHGESPRWLDEMDPQDRPREDPSR